MLLAAHLVGYKALCGCAHRLRGVHCGSMRCTQGSQHSKRPSLAPGGMLQNMQRSALEAIAALPAMPAHHTSLLADGCGLAVCEAAGSGLSRHGRLHGQGLEGLLGEPPAETSAQRTASSAAPPLVRSHVAAGDIARAATESALTCGVPPQPTPTYCLCRPCRCAAPAKCSCVPSTWCLAQFSADLQ